MKVHSAIIVRNLLTVAAAAVALTAVGCLAYSQYVYKQAEEGIPGNPVRSSAQPKTDETIEQSEFSCQPMTGTKVQRVFSL